MFTDFLIMCMILCFVMQFFQMLKNLLYGLMRTISFVSRITKLQILNICLFDNIGSIMPRPTFTLLEIQLKDWNYFQ